jgi:hypothetical protein
MSKILDLSASAIANGVVANLATLLVTGLVAWLWYVSLGRRGLMKFFGVARGKPLRIYVGHVPSPERLGYVGFEEISQAKDVEAMFKSVVPGLGNQPGLLRLLQVADIQTEILSAAPNSQDVTLDHSLVSLGLPTSNFASFLLETELHSPVKYNRNTCCIEIPFLKPIDANDQGFVVRIHYGDKNYFYVGGKPETTTAGCARYLIQNWKSMRKRYGDKTSFYYLLRVVDPGTVISMTDHELQVPG